MLYEDEFRLYATQSKSMKSYKREFKTSMFNSRSHIVYTIYIGCHLFEAGNNSKPIDTNFALSQYEAVIVALDDLQNYLLPSQISKSLTRFDKSSVGDGKLQLKLTLYDAEDLYVELCKMFSVDTKSIIKFFCLECGIPLIQNSNFCWACEKGI